MASTQMITKAVELKTEDLSYSPLKVLDNGGKMVWIAHKGAPLIMQLPKMTAPFGISRWADDKVEKYSLDLSFKGDDENVAKAHEIFKSLDTKIVQDAMDNSPAWFKKKISSVEVMEALYHPIVRVPKDPKYADTIKLPLAYDGGNFKCLAFDTTKKPVNLLDINAKGAVVTSIIQCTGIWIAGGKFGCSWKVLQLKIAPKPSLAAYAFKDDDDEEDTAAGTSNGGGDEDEEGAADNITDDELDI